MRVLDEVADAVQLARGGRAFPVVASAMLKDQFQGQVVAAHWKRMERHLKCSLPPLDFDQGHYFLPEELVTVWDLCEYIAERHANWQPPTERTVSSWRNAQIFAGMRRVLVDACCLRPEKIERTSHLMRDLGMG